MNPRAIFATVMLSLPLGLKSLTTAERTPATAPARPHPAAVAGTHHPARCSRVPRTAHCMTPMDAPHTARVMPTVSAALNASSDSGMSNRYQDRLIAPSTVAAMAPPRTSPTLVARTHHDKKP